MLKNILIILGAVITVVILCFTGIKLYTSYQASQYDEAAIPFLQQVIPEISTWEEAAIRRSLSEEALQHVSNKDFSQIVARFSRLGALQSFETPQFDQVSESRSENALTGGGPVKTSVIYTSDAVYEHGDAIITLKLAVRDEQLVLQYFTIQSLVLTQ